MAYHHTVMGQILKLVSRHEFEGEARKHHERGWLRKMTRGDSLCRNLSGRLRFPWPAASCAIWSESG